MQQADQIFGIEPVPPSQYQEATELWEASVRDTHHFLKEEAIAFYKPMVHQHYLPSVQLVCVRDKQNRMLGFMGTSGDKIEMLFLHPDWRWQGIGKILVNYAIRARQVTIVDVNEQNNEAIGFYKRLGFIITGRTELDGTGKPYPVLQLELPRC